MFGNKLFEALKDVEGVNTEDLQRARELGNRMDQQANMATALLTPNGNLSPNIFSHHSESFSILPHEVGSIINGSADADSISNATWSTPTITSPHISTFSRGLKIDVANARVHVSALAGDTEILVLAWCDFAANADGERGVRIVTNDSSVRSNVVPASANNDGAQVIHIRVAPQDLTWYTFEVFQSSGGALVLDFANMVVVRLR